MPPVQLSKSSIPQTRASQLGNSANYARNGLVINLKKKKSIFYPKKKKKIDKTSSIYIFMILQKKKCSIYLWMYVPWVEFLAAADSWLLFLLRSLCPANLLRQLLFDSSNSDTAWNLHSFHTHHSFAFLCFFFSPSKFENFFHIESENSKNT